MPKFKRKIQIIKDALTKTATSLQQEKYDMLSKDRFLCTVVLKIALKIVLKIAGFFRSWENVEKKLSSIELEYENLEYQLEEAGDLELDDNLWDGQTIPDSSDLDPFEKTATKFELVIENINDLNTALQTPFQKVDDSEHRIGS